MKKFLKAAATFAAFAATCTAFAFIVTPTAPVTVGILTAAAVWLVN